MPERRKRKVSASDDLSDSQRSKRRSVDGQEEHEDHQETTESADTNETPSDPPQSNAASKALERQERFKALQARAKKSADHNLHETRLESQRLSTDPALLTSLSRKHAFASHNLLKADTEAAGEDFERKRAWDWTIEESEKWDKRMDKKQRHRDDVAFQDYRQDSRKVYKRQIRDMNTDLEGYDRDKMKAIEKAAASGGLEIVEMEGTGELIAVDKDGTFYSTAESTDFMENKPDRAAVDRLVNDLTKAEETRLRKRRERGRVDDDQDTTYINEKVCTSSQIRIVQPADSANRTSNLTRSFGGSTTRYVTHSKAEDWPLYLHIENIADYEYSIRPRSETASKGALLSDFLGTLVSALVELLAITIVQPQSMRTTIVLADTMLGEWVARHSHFGSGGEWTDKKILTYLSSSDVVRGPLSLREIGVMDSLAF
jgi:pre-mRNA-splicing factor SYF2